ncbi:glycine-rich domain-containing protein [Pseudomonas abietaniphila]|uniref:Glycine-rich domain-containing protein-like n=1 Tax=Pseudomonas abietaniphila TaxID=89065 RepID=A0A1G7YXI0_9PSED|nr:glycine-rich domain-containing protein-like [Pseudomonas abietaniphila]SDH01151.1 Protein of unknown function [Pseudomonas abietaniphila]
MDKQYKKIQDTLPHSMSTPVNKNHEPTLEQAVHHINNIDFSLIQKKICAKDALTCRVWSETEAEIAIQYYKNFLYLNKKYLHQFSIIPPMLEVDEIWHHHILDTRQYFKDCHSIFGYYFHHYPYFGTRGTPDKRNLDTAFNVAQTLHEKEFGSKMLAIWSDSDALL